ncbi:rhodanese-like domain-containing protein [Thalassorhabdomicrobium marinisediminis]|uniref:Rhodanese-like domain-containing protein n=1 Tax=Thalassorhabdomicrobium marinisediminis TaxID=2170577 RepID=A0A2T7FX60_9RHOB|nr:rhodanese-like domain-containing protein [Thalassorhabdomicrobium marinisediminis]PVA06718.1 rhodanese-like domain-containing protein [Thalassorhabdomicrobium marinisediminis]
MKTETTDNGRLDVWTPQEVSEALAKGEITLIDVRSPEEFTVERIPGALLFPMQGFEARHLPAQGDKPIVLHCGSGMRSGKMADKVLADQKGPIAHMDGGMGAWKKAGLDYIAINKATGAPEVTRDD